MTIILLMIGVFQYMVWVVKTMFILTLKLTVFTMKIMCKAVYYMLYFMVCAMVTPCVLLYHAISNRLAR